MDPVFSLIEHSGLSRWIRESSVVFPALLVMHTLGMGFAAGPGMVIDLRILGVAKRIPLPPLARLFPVIWLGFTLNLISGVLLLIGYPTKALTNPVFYLKLACIALAVGLLPVLRDQLARHPTGSVEALPTRLRRLAALSLVLWLAAITAGRLLAYTHSRLLVDLKANF